MLTFEDDGVALEDLELVHLGLGHLDDRVVVLLRVLDLQLVRRLLAIHDRRREVLRFSATHIELSKRAISSWGLELLARTYPSSVIG